MKEEPSTIRPPSVRGPQLEGFSLRSRSQARPRYICPAPQRDQPIETAVAERILEEVLALEGAMAATVINCRRGEAITSRILDSRMNAADLVAGAVRLHREVLCGESEHLEEALVVLSGSIRLLRSLQGGDCAVYLVVDRTRGSMGLARYTMASLRSLEQASPEPNSVEPNSSEPNSSEPGSVEPVSSEQSSQSAPPEQNSQSAPPEQGSPE